MCRHRDEFARDLEIELLSLLEICKVLVQDQRDGNVLDLYFIFRQQEENEVERPFKVLQRLRAALVHHALQLENGIVHSLHLNTIRFTKKEYTREMAVLRILSPTPSHTSTKSTAMPYFS